MRVQFVPDDTQTLRDDEQASSDDKENTDERYKNVHEVHLHVRQSQMRRPNSSLGSRLGSNSNGLHPATRCGDRGSKADSAHDRFAQKAAIPRRIGERAKSTLSRHRVSGTKSRCGAAPFLATGQPPQFAPCSTRRAGARSKLSRLWSTSSLRYAGRARATANVILRLVEIQAGRPIGYNKGLMRNNCFSRCRALARTGMAWGCGREPAPWL
jgi:hypothetical protein